MEDHQSYGEYYGAGGRGKNSKEPKPSSNVGPLNDIVLTRLDGGFPKDIPYGTQIYIKSWYAELREACWAIASSRSLSAHLRIHKRIEAPLSVRHLLVGLSEKVNSDNGALGDFKHLQKFLKEDGAILEEDCKCVEPLFGSKNARGKAKSKPMLCTDKRHAKRTFKVKDLIILEEVDEKQLISLLNKGPVAVGLNFYDEFKNFRGDGIYKGPKKISGDQIRKHMVLCYGYGTVNGIHFWKIQNSAGTSWGNGGFGKVIRQVSRNKGEPSLLTFVVYPELLEVYEDEE